MTYLVLLAIGALDAVGYGMIVPVVPEIAARTGAGPGLVGALVTSFAVGMLVGYPIAGRLIARRGAASALALAVALVAAGDLAFVSGDGLAVYFPARLVQGLGAGGLWMGAVFGILERWPGQEYRRLSVLLAAFSVGGVAGPALGAVGGVRGPFLLHLALTALVALALLRLGAPAERRPFVSDRSVLRTPGFLLSALGVLAIALGVGTLEGPLPLHFADRLDQQELAALYVGASALLGLAAAVAGRYPPRPLLALSLCVFVPGIALAGAANGVALWVVAVAVAAIGFGIGEAGALGVLLDSVGVERIVFAMVVWSQAWGIGYLAGPAASGGLVQWLGFAAVGIVPLAAALVCGAAFLRSGAASQPLAQAE